MLIKTFSKDSFQHYSWRLKASYLHVILKMNVTVHNLYMKVSYNLYRYMFIENTFILLIHSKKSKRSRGPDLGIKQSSVFKPQTHLGTSVYQIWHSSQSSRQHSPETGNYHVDCLLGCIRILRNYRRNPSIDIK